MKINNLLNKIVTIFNLLVVTGIVLLVAYHMELLTGHPKGVDVYAYLTKVRLIIEHFPYINWNPYWDSGTPFSIWSYPPAAMSLVALIVKAGSITVGTGLTIMAAVSFVILAIGIYGLVSRTTGSKMAAILTVLVLVSSPASWSWWNGGNYVRIFGLGMLGAALFFNSCYLDGLAQGRQQKGLYLVAILSFAAVLMSHLLLGGVALVLISLFYFFSELSFPRKIKEFFKVFLPAFALAAYWYLPLFLTGKPASRFIGRDPAFPIRLDNFFSPYGGEENFSLSVNVLPFVALAVVIFITAIVFKKLKLARFQKGMLLTFLMATLGNLFYDTVGYLPFYPQTGYIIGFPPITAFSLFSIVTVIFGGLLLGTAVQGLKKGIGYLIISLALVFSVWGVFHDFSSLKKGVDDVMTPGSLQGLGQQVIDVNYPHNYRFGTDSAFVADWFNWKYETYQTRDYFGQGITYPDWQNWFETAVWYWEDNLPETKFLLSWYGVREFFVGNPHFKYQKFLQAPDDFQVENHQALVWQGLAPLEYYQFEYKNTSEILTTTNAPTVLVIGKKAGYDYFLRALAKTGLDSRQIIPLRGREKIDSYSAEELSLFDGLVLYEYDYNNQTQAMNLLKTFLAKGKTIIWDTHSSPESGRNAMPALLPMKKISSERLWGSWQVQKGVNLTSGSQILREENGFPLVVAWETGGGKVIWSGLNLPFFILEKKTAEETDFFGKIIAGEFVREVDQPAYQAKFVNPEKREITLKSPAKGILLKESFMPNWQATLGGKRTEIYPAGPDLMYVFNRGNKANKAVFEYKISSVEMIARVISLLTLILLLIYTFEGTLLKRGMVKVILSPFVNLPRKLLKKISGSWDEAE